MEEKKASNIFAIIGLVLNLIGFFIFPLVFGTAISELYLNKIADLSATYVRNLMKEDKEEEWRKCVPWRLYSKYKEIRDKVLAAEGNTETASI